jgi:hypothetical protein
VIDQPRAEPALRAEHEDVDEAGDDRRDGEGKVDQGREEALAPEAELRDRPRRADAEDDIGRDDDRDREQSQADRRKGVGIADRGKVESEALVEGLGKDDDERQDEEEGQERQRDRRQYPARPRGIAHRAGRGGAGRP